MKQHIYPVIRNSVFLTLLVFIAMNVSAQEPVNKAYEDAKKEITETLGMFPTMFKIFPKYALPGAWQAFKELRAPGSKIPPKYRELMQLAVASQIPCMYCVYFHTISAKSLGASDDEIQEAVAHGADTRHWSMILQGNQVDYETFKKEAQAMLKYMTEHAQK